MAGAYEMSKMPMAFQQARRRRRTTASLRAAWLSFSDIDFSCVGVSYICRRAAALPPHRNTIYYHAQDDGVGSLRGTSATQPVASRCTAIGRAENSR